jgi:hypothetical protein
MGARLGQGHKTCHGPRGLAVLIGGAPEMEWRK